MTYIIRVFKGITAHIVENFRKCFSGANLLWQVLAVVSTFVFVATGFDWEYFKFLSHGWVLYFFLPATIIGFLVPVFLPLILLSLAVRRTQLLRIAYATAQAGFLGWLISIIYKSLTGRVHPVLHSIANDISHNFRFGFLRGGVFWGWPSSHTAVAFAIGVLLFKLYPGNNKIKFWALFYSFYIGLGVSMTIHWFSDFVAGAIIGAIVGSVVADSFIKSQTYAEKN